MKNNQDQIIRREKESENIKNNGSEPIRVVLAADDNYAQHLGVTLVSILENLKKERKIEFYILSNGLSQINQKKIKNISEIYRVALAFYEIADSFLKDCPEVNHLSRATYSRILIAELLPLNFSRVLYLDSDTVVLGDIGELYDQKLENYGLAAVPDVMAKEILRIYFYSGLEDYFNAGVLLINLDFWRREKVFEKSLEFVKCYRENLLRADQDVLNCLFRDSWLRLSDKFNLDLKRCGVTAQPKAETIILHYSDRVKPWQYTFLGRSRRYYFQYLKKTPWHDFSFSDKNWRNFLVRYGLAVFKFVKRRLSLFIPNRWLDVYRRRLWKTYVLK